MIQRKSVVLDIMKVITLLLVVIGHVTRMYTPQSAVPIQTKCALFEYITTIIYEFHMPCFFMVSGAVFYIAKNRNRYSSWRVLIVNKCNRLLVPYVCVALLCVLPTMCFIGVADGHIWKYVWSSYILMEDPRHLWFIVTLFSVFVCFNLFHGFIVKHPIIAVAISLIVHIVSSHLPGIFQINHVCFYFLYFLGGYLIYGHKEVFTACRCHVLLIIVAILCVALNSQIVCQLCQFAYTGPIIKIVNIVAAISGSFLIYEFSHFLSLRPACTQVLYYFVPDSYGVYLFHPMIIYILSYLIRDISINPHISGTGIFLLSFILSIGLTRLCRYVKVDFIIGERKVIS